MTIKNLGLMALYNFPLAIECLEDLSQYCDALIVRFDANGDQKLLNYAVNHKKIIKVLYTKEKWNSWNFREDLVGLTDSINPELLLFLDEDEKFEKDIREDIYEFRQKPEAKYMRFLFKMVPNNLEPWPSDHHVKVIKWQPKLTYYPYPGWARTVSYLGIPGASYNAKTKIIHYHYAHGNRDKH
ncbi:MAG: hypothetical protein ACFFG0_04660 [Candidatus Thorarchaeota archaeon]